MSRITKSDLGTLADSAGLDTLLAGRFSRAIRLTLATGGLADRATIAPGALLNTRFLSRNLDALDPGAPETATLSTSSGQLVLSLPVARKVRSVRLKEPRDGDLIAAFRFDGQAVSEDPVKTATHNQNGARLNVTDSALILKRTNGGEFALTAGEIDAVLLRYTPVNPRLALRLPGETGPGTPFPVQTDADGVPVFPADGIHGAELAAAMEGLLARLPSPLPDPLEVDLILSADQPCSARIDALDLSLVLETQAFAQKAVLRFGGGRRDRQSLSLTLPSGAQLFGGTLSVSVSSTPPGEQLQSAPLNPLPQATGEGLRIADASPAATLMNLDAAQAIAGAELVLAAPNGPADLRAMLYEDRGGQPGDALSESAPRRITRAAPTVTGFSFAPRALPAGAVWLGVAAVSGTAIALLGGTGKLASMGGPAWVIVDDEASGGLAAALRPVSPASSPAESGGPTLSLGDSTLPRLPATGTAAIDLAAAVQSLSGTPELHVSSTTRAIVTIAPPLLRYGLL